MDRVHQLGLGVGLHQPAQGVHNLGHRRAVVLPPVAGDQNHFFPIIVQLVQEGQGKTKITGHRGLQRVDHRVACHENSLGDPFRRQVPAVELRWAEVERGDVAHQRAVDLFREGRVLVPGPQPGLHMSHGNLLVKGGQRPGKGGGGIPVDQHQVGPRLLQHVLHAQQALGRNGGQGLAWLHDIQIKIRRDAKDGEYGIQHFSVLGGDAAQTLHTASTLQFPDQRSHFDGLRTGSENGHDTDTHGFSSPSPPFSSGSSSGASPLRFPFRRPVLPV